MKKSLLHCILIALITLSCAEKSDPSFDQKNFTSIIDNKIFSSGIYPIDIRQTSDGGYLVLAERTIQESNFRGVYLMKADKFGKFVKETMLDDNFVNPIGPMLLSGTSVAFVCMDAFSLQAQLVTTDEANESTTTAAISGITYPAAIGIDGTSGFVMLSYDQADKNTVISRHSMTGAFLGNALALNIGAGEDVEEPIINHFLRTGRRLPFQVGKIPGGQYFFNGFYNYTLSLVFTDFSPNGTLGVVQGQQDDGGFSAVYPLGGNRFAASRFNFGDNFFLPNVTLTTSGTSSGVELGGFSFPELTTNATVRILIAPIKGSNTLLFASDTKSKQVGLFFYNESTGEFLSSRYLGFSNPFEVASMSTTSDEGLIVCGTTYLAGRFPRICLLKISKEELAKQL
ncbi:MAG TPA: hypothetical protein VGD65_10360 [Chryseosolibacter sp.]